MAPSVALGEPLIQEVAHSRTSRAGKVALLCLIGVACAAIWALNKDEQQGADVEPAMSMPAMAMQLPQKGLSMQPARPMQLPQMGLSMQSAWPMMQPVNVRQPVAVEAHHKRTWPYSPVRGTAVRPRLVVHKSNKHIRAQLLDDRQIGETAEVKGYYSTLQMEGGKKSKEAAKVIGEKIAEQAYAKGINQVVFDRKGYRYHGIVKEVAEAVREAGLLDNENPNRKKEIDGAVGMDTLGFHPKSGLR